MKMPMVLSVLGLTLGLWATPAGWSDNFAASTNTAVTESRPLVLVWSKGASCAYCVRLGMAVEQPKFVNWQDESGYIFCYVEGTATADAKAAKAFAKGGSSFPFVALYWPSKTGVLEERFCGRIQESKYLTDKTAKYADSQDLDELAQVVMDKADALFADWTDYSGGAFVVRDSPGDRLETLAGVAARMVAIPLARENSEDSYTNWLTASFSDNVITTKVEWAKGEDRVYPVLNVPANMIADTKIALKLWDNEWTEKESSVIHVVTDPGNGVQNPYWMGEKTVDALGFGEWTMDFDVATNKTARTVGDAHTLVLITGALWCPWCGGLENGVLNTAAFKNLAKDNKLTLAILDNAKRPTGDTGVTSSYTEETADTNLAYTISTVQTGAGPTLLRYDRGTSYWKTGDDLFSGASYLSRKGIVTAADRALAEAVLKRNLDLGYAGGLLCEPGTMRSNFGCLILLDKAGKVVGRWVREAPNKQFDTTENIQRLEDMLKTASAHPVEDGYAATSALVHALGASGTTKLSVNARQKVYRMTGMPTKGRVTFRVTENATTRPITLKLLVKRALDVKRVDANGNPVESAECEVGTPIAVSETTPAPTLTYDLTSSDDYYLKVSAFADAENVCYGTTDTDISVSFSSSLVLTPEESKQTLAAAAESYAFAIDPANGRTYRFDGFAAADLATSFDGPENGVYTLKDEIENPVTLRFRVADGAEQISYRLWRPGTVAFRDEAIQVFKLVGSNEVVICRDGGACDAVSFRVRVGAGSAENGIRYVWDESKVYSWADGESAPKSIWLTMNQDQPYTTNEIVRLELVAAGPSATELSDTTLMVTLCDTDKPTLARSQYEVQLYSGFDVSLDEVLDVYNIQGNGSITLRKTSGSLPSGVKLAYDKTTRSLVVSGTPSKVASSKVTYTLSEKRGRTTVTGPEVTFVFTVTDPADLNEWLSRDVALSLPVFRTSETNEMVGLIAFSATSKNKLSAKYVCAANTKTVSFSGRWSRLGEDGTASAVLTAKNVELSLQFSVDGACQATLVDARYPGETLWTGIYYALDEADYADCAGKYTVALPQVEVANEEGVGGAGYLTIDFTSKSRIRKGQVPYSGVLPDGSRFTGSVTLAGLDDDFASVPVFVSLKNYVIALPLKLRWNAAIAAQTMSRRAIVVQDEKSAQWYGPRQSGLFSAYGSYLDETVALTNYFGDSQMTLAFSCGPVESSITEVYGQGATVAVKEKSVSLVPSVSGVKISYAAKTGVFSGSTRVVVNGRTKSAKFAGVILPDWNDCGSCGGDDDPIIPALEHDQPASVVGQLTVSSTVGIEMMLVD